MVDKQHEMVTEYESVVKQKKAYKKLLQNMQEEYDGYCAMLQADYPLQLD
jgi:hypothetical protein